MAGNRSRFSKHEMTGSPIYFPSLFMHGDKLLMTEQREQLVRQEEKLVKMWRKDP